MNGEPAGRDAVELCSISLGCKVSGTATVQALVRGIRPPCCQVAAITPPSASPPAGSVNPPRGADVPGIEAVLRDYGAALSRIAGSYERSAAGRDDLVQDMILALMQALPRFRGDSALGTYVYRVATNQAIDRLARRAPAMLDLAQAPDLPDPGPGPDHHYNESDRRERLLAAIRQLPLSLRQVITLVLEGLSHGEIGDVLGITENNVGVRANRARVRLRELLREEKP